MKIIMFFITLTLGGCSFAPFTGFNEDKNPFGPWHGFIYEATARNEETRVYHGDFDGLTNCMQMLQAKTLYSKFAYFCGYNCTGMIGLNASYTCEKVMGSPLTTLD